MHPSSCFHTPCFSNHSGNLAQILKTPSRTPRTVPKTRTGIAKEKERGEKIRLANANLGSRVDEEDEDLVLRKSSKVS
jgi:hypothetical protein